MGKRLRFGILCESLHFRSWQSRCLEDVLALDNVSLDLIIRPQVQKERHHKEKGRWANNLFFKTYKKLWFHPKCYCSIDWSHLESEIQQISCHINRVGKYSEYFRPDDIDIIKSKQLDFLLLFSGFGIIRGEILNTAKYGVWSYHHDDEEKYRGTPSCFWEIYWDDPINAAILQRLTDRLDGGVILRKGYFKTINHNYTKNLDNIHFQSSGWVRELCVDLLNKNYSAVSNLPANTSAPVYTRPTNVQMLIFVLKIFSNKLRKICKNMLLTEQWNVGVIHKPITDLARSITPPEIEWLFSPNRREFFADPFAVESHNSIKLFYENYNRIEGKANIAVTEFDKNFNEVKGKKISFENNNHISYPFVFTVNKKLYMIPEMWASGEIGLYELDVATESWSKEAVLIPGIEAVDATLFQYDKKWWITCTLKNQSPDVRLFVFYSNQLLTGWKAHKKNPVKTDIRSSRPAGNLFWLDNKLIRPAQDSQHTYGGRIVLNEIVTLTESEFEEQQIGLIEPSKNGVYTQGIHTISILQDKVVVDGKRNIVSLWPLINFLKKKLPKWNYGAII